MPMPKKKIYRAWRGHRRSHDALSRPAVRQCPNCASVVRPHHVCPSCGHYKGKEIVTPKA